MVDPDYSRFIVKARVIAKQEGYAIAIHGSTTRDLDLIAIPWIPEVCIPCRLVSRIAFNTGFPLQAADGNRAGMGAKVKPVEREHGRLVWTFLTPEAHPGSPNWPDPRFVDFSVMPPNTLLYHPCQGTGGNGGEG